MATAKVVLNPYNVSHLTPIIPAISLSKFPQGFSASSCKTLLHSSAISSILTRT